MNTLKELEDKVSQACIKAKNMLYDSPICLGKELERQIGYYLGYCHAKGWFPSHDFIYKCRAL